MKTISAELPEKLFVDMKTVINDGWFSNEDDLIIEAIRRFIDTHQANLTEKFVKEDVEWGLHGKV